MNVVIGRDVTLILYYGTEFSLISGRQSLQIAWARAGFGFLQPPPGRAVRFSEFDKENTENNAETVVYILLTAKTTALSYRACLARFGNWDTVTVVPATVYRPLRRRGYEYDRTTNSPVE
jgi:hypothetical protein